MLLNKKKSQKLKNETLCRKKLNKSQYVSIQTLKLNNDFSDLINQKTDLQKSRMK